jgi:hypothetical protein
VVHKDDMNLASALSFPSFPSCRYVDQLEGCTFVDVLGRYNDENEYIQVVRPSVLNSIREREKKEKKIQWSVNRLE